MATLYSRAGFPFDDKAAWASRLQASITSELAKVKSRLTNEAWQTALSLGVYLSNAVSGVLSASAVNIANSVDSVFPQFATRNVLELWGTILGLPPLGSDFATGNVRFYSSSNGTTIALGTVIVASDGQRFETTLAGVCNISDPGTGYYYCVVPVLALTAGVAANLEATSEFSASPAITNIQLISNTVAFIGGREVEETETYRARIISRIQNPPSGGSASDLEAWAEGNSSVLKAWVKEAYPQPGLATVYYLRNGGDPVPLGSGSAYRLLIVAILNPSGTTWQVSTNKAALDAILGWIPDKDYFVDGTITFGQSSGLEGQEFEIAAVAISGSDYLFTVVGEIDTTAGARTFGLFDLRDATTAAVRESILYDANGLKRTPLGMDTIEKMPAISDDQPYVEFTISPATEQVANDALEAIRILLRDAEQGTTLDNWLFHEAIAAVPGHESHVLLGVGTLATGDTPTGSIAISDSEIFTLFQAQINGVTSSNQEIWE